MNVSIVSQILVVGILTVCLSDVCVAATILSDDFEDGEIFDGTPAEWQRLPSFSGSIYASAGNLVLEPTDPSGFKTTLVVSSGVSNKDVSIRAQVRMLEVPETLGEIAVIARANTSTLQAYFAGIESDGSVYIDRDGTPGRGVALIKAPTDLRPTEEDIMLQFDVFDNLLELWAWRPGEPMPGDPLLTLTDDTYSNGGEVGAFYSYQDAASSLAGIGNGAIRHILVSDTHIPEPTSMALIGIACSGLMFHRILNRCWALRGCN